MQIPEPDLRQMHAPVLQRSTSVQTFVLFLMPMPLNVKGTLPHTSLCVGLRKDKPDTQLCWPFKVNSDLTQEPAPSLRTKVPTTGLSLFFQHYQDTLINTWGAIT